MIYVISISLQVAGALLLMTNSLLTRRDKVIKRFADSRIIFRDNNTNSIIYDKVALKELYREAYLSKFAFLFIAIGYFLGVFGSADDCSKFLVAGEIIVLTISFMILSHFIVRMILKYNKEVNREITNDELNKLGIEPDIENVSADDIYNLF